MRKVISLVAPLALFAAALAPAANAADNPLPPAVSREADALSPLIAHGDGSLSLGQVKHQQGAICSTSSTSFNVNTDCEPAAPHNETSIAVNPTNQSNIIGSANDYQLELTSGGVVHETVLSRAHVTFDGGHTWTTYGLDISGVYPDTGDPAVAFDATGRAYIATLGFLYPQGSAPTGVNADVLVNHSTDGGKTWVGVTVAHGTGSFGSVGKFNDKEYIAAWGNGNAIVTWTQFNGGIKGSYITSPIYDSVTHDGGNTWSAPQEIGGSASFCGPSGTGGPCEYGTGSIPAVAADGSIYVSFEEQANFDPSSLGYGRDEYLVVKVNPTTGARSAGPYKVADLVDGYYDYPINVDGRQTYQDSEFRTWSLGDIATDPTNASHLAVIWSDMRNSPHPSSSPGSYGAFLGTSYADPYSTTTNSDVVVSQSFNGGVTWSAPTAITKPGDQFMPWGEYDTSGKLRLGYFDRSYDPANNKYGYTLATESMAGSLSFGTTEVTTALSDPTKNDRWFSGFIVNPAFPHPTAFMGDYSNIAAKPGGGVVLYWTDMRNSVCFTVRCGHGQDAYFASEQ